MGTRHRDGCRGDTGHIPSLEPSNSLLFDRRMVVATCISRLISVISYLLPLEIRLQTIYHTLVDSARTILCGHNQNYFISSGLVPGTRMTTDAMSMLYCNSDMNISPEEVVEQFARRQARRILVVNPLDYY